MNNLVNELNELIDLYYITHEEWIELEIDIIKELIRNYKEV